MTQNIDQKPTPKELVKLFPIEVRSGLHPDKAFEYLNETVISHQINAENSVMIKRAWQTMQIMFETFSNF